MRLSRLVFVVIVVVCGNLRAQVGVVRLEPDGSESVRALERSRLALLQARDAVDSALLEVEQALAALRPSASAGPEAASEKRNEPRTFLLAARWKAMVAALNVRLPNAQRHVKAIVDQVQAVVRRFDQVVPPRATVAADAHRPASPAEAAMPLAGLARPQESAVVRASAPSFGEPRAVPTSGTLETARDREIIEPLLPRNPGPSAEPETPAAAALPPRRDEIPLGAAAEDESGTER